MALGRIIGGALGWALFGPFGAFLGFTVGGMFENIKVGDSAQIPGGSLGGRGQQTQQGDFNISLVVLSAAVMKADGKQLKSELRYIQSFFEQQFGKQAAGQYITMLQEFLKKEIPLQDVSSQIGRYMAMPMKLQLLHYLYGIAKSDGHVHSSEVDCITLIANYMRIPTADQVSIRNMFYQEVDSSYKILEITSKATDAEVKKAYRRMAVRFHPDKVSTLSKKVQEDASDKFIKVQEAYEQIKKERGMN
jgi:DnaJ like chaperone protein